MLPGSEIAIVRALRARDGTAVLDDVFGDHAGWAAIRPTVAAGPPNRMFLAMDGSRALGAVVWGDDGVIHALGLLPQARGRGIGTRLLDAAESAIRASGGRGAVLGSVDESVGFYLARGYTAELLVQFAPGECGYDTRADRLAAMLSSYELRRAVFDGRPQLFVRTGGVDFDLADALHDADPLVHTQFVMSKAFAA